jgi:hypothetical protein
VTGRLPFAAGWFALNQTKWSILRPPFFHAGLQVLWFGLWFSRQVSLSLSLLGRSLSLLCEVTDCASSQHSPSEHHLLCLPQGKGMGWAALEHIIKC